MSEREQRFASVVLAAFVAAELSTDVEIVRAGGPSNSTLTKYRAARDDGAPLAEPREPTWSKIDKAARWEPGSARRVWAGEDPTPVRPVQQDPSYVEAEGERVEADVTNAEIMRELRDMRRDLDELRRRVGS